MARKKKYDYFEAFKDQVDIALKEAHLLAKVFEDYEGADSLHDVLERAHEIENAGDKINHCTFEAITTDFITPFDRDDIIDISSSLDDIVDKLESTIRLFYMMDVHAVHPRCKDLAECVIKSLEALSISQDDFSDFKKSKKFKSSIEDVNSYEEHADNVYMGAMRQLFAEESDDPIHVIKWSRVFDKLENCCDACEHVADVMESVVLKNS